MLIFEPFLWCVFRLMNVIADLKQGVSFNPTANIHYPETYKSTADDFLWVFCSTIGELNACKPLIKEISKDTKLVLLTDRDCYKDAYLQHFPTAIVVELSGQAAEGQVLLKQLPPSDIIVCEIPCTPHDAPCRLSYGLLREAKKKAVKISLINGWLYHYPPSCKMDAIERWLFSRYYIQLFDLMVVQTDDVRQELIRLGGQDEKIKISKNIKFDSLTDTRLQIKDDESNLLVNEFSAADYPVVVAGCVTDIWEFELLLSAYIKLLEKTPSARIVLAPRHPENQNKMQEFKTLLVNSKLVFCFKSEQTCETLQQKLASLQILVLDTIGELRGYYSCGNVCYVGRDHNILEPLAFRKPVVVYTEWEPTFPSYPVYEVTKKENLIHEVDDMASMAAAFDALLETPATEEKEFCASLSKLTGGKDKTLGFLKRY